MDEKSQCLGAGGSRMLRGVFGEGSSSSSKPDISKFQERFRNLHQRRVKITRKLSNII